MIQVPIPTELETFVEGIVRDGTYQNPTEVVGEALRLLARRDQVVREVKTGVSQLDQGDFVEYGEDSEHRFVADIRKADIGPESDA
jgi:putative addiction module CopG family antidote